MTNTKKLVIISLLVALTVVLARFISFQSDIVRISIEFFPIAVAAILLGPVAGGITAVLADIIGALLFPFGTFFPGFTFSAFLTGIIYGLFFYNKNITVVKTIICVIAKLVVVDLVLVTLWLMILYKAPLAGLMVPRIIKVGIMLPIEFTLIYFGARPLIVQLKKRLAFKV